MKKIRFAYRILIDSKAQSLVEKYIFEDTYKEYLLQHQLFNSKENPKATFRELLHENPKAEQLHFLLHIAANGYLEQLNGLIYKVPDFLGKNYMPFESFQLDIINTDITDITKHKIGITFYSPLLLWLDTINNCFLVSQQIENQNNFETMMFQFQNNLSICYLEHI